jgi:hypothetical protein
VKQGTVSRWSGVGLGRGVFAYVALWLKPHNADSPVRQCGRPCLVMRTRGEDDGEDKEGDNDDDADNIWRERERERETERDRDRQTEREK